MAIGTTNSNLYQFDLLDGPRLRMVRIDVTGLAAGNNAVPHGLKDQNGSGVSDDFTMPDVGGSARTVSVDAEITEGSTVTKASDFIKWAPAGSGALVAVRLSRLAA